MLKKICFVQTGVYKLFNNKSKVFFGGSELQLYLIAKELNKGKEYDISFVAGDFGQKEIEKCDRIKIYKSFNPKKGDGLLKKIFNAFRYFKLFKKINADIYFTSSANSTVGLVSLFCKFNKKKHIHRTAHDIDVDKSFIDRNGLIGKIYRYGLINADVVLTQNNEHKKLLNENHNIEAVLFKNVVKIIKQNTKNKSYILWVGRYEKWKQPELFLKLAKLFKSEDFIMICPENTSLIKARDILKNKTKLINNLSFIDFVNYNDIQKYFNEAKVFINTSIFEGFPNTYIQAGLGKTPIISLNVNPDDFINEYDCGYFCENDFNLMIDRMKLLLSDKKLWELQSENIYNYVNKNHDIMKNIDILKELFEKLYYI